MGNVLQGVITYLSQVVAGLLYAKAPPSLVIADTINRFVQADLANTTGGDASFEKELIETYIESTDSQLEKFKAALKDSDAVNARIYVHSIKGASTYIGANRVHMMAKTLESYCAEEQLDRVRHNMGVFEEEIRLTQKVLDEYKQKQL